jgi:hypothetical protein
MQTEKLVLGILVSRASACSMYNFRSPPVATFYRGGATHQSQRSYCSARIILYFVGLSLHS